MDKPAAKRLVCMVAADVLTEQCHSGALVARIGTKLGVDAPLADADQQRIDAAAHELTAELSARGRGDA